MHLLSPALGRLSHDCPGLVPHVQAVRKSCLYISEVWKTGKPRKQNGKPRKQNGKPRKNVDGNRNALSKS